MLVNGVDINTRPPTLDEAQQAIAALVAELIRVQGIAIDRGNDLLQARERACNCSRAALHHRT